MMTSTGVQHECRCMTAELIRLSLQDNRTGANFALAASRPLRTNAITRSAVRALLASDARQCRSAARPAIACASVVANKSIRSEPTTAETERQSLHRPKPVLHLVGFNPSTRINRARKHDQDGSRREIQLAAALDGFPSHYRRSAAIASSWTVRPWIRTRARHYTVVEEVGVIQDPSGSANGRQSRIEGRADVRLPRDTGRVRLAAVEDVYWRTAAVGKSPAAIDELHERSCQLWSAARGDGLVSPD